MIDRHLQPILEAIHNQWMPTDRPFLIAISGFGGSGKSTLARALEQALENTLKSASIVGMDEFWNPDGDVRSSDWTAFDRDRLEAQVLLPARSGQAIRYQEFDWQTAQLGAWRDVPASQYLIIEGISALHPNLLEYYDFRVWVDCPLETARDRGLARGQAWGNDETEIWTTRWQPNDHDYFQKYRPDRLADFVYSNLETSIKTSTETR
jgi:uridine kinase